MDGSIIQTLTEECNNRGATINALLPVYLKALSPLLDDLEHARNKPAVICIGEREYSYPQMAKLIRDVSPEGVNYAMDWLDADIRLRKELLNP